MSNLFYLLAISFIIISFTFVVVLPKFLFSKEGLELSYKYLVPRYLIFSAIFSLIGAFILSRSLYLPIDLIPFAALEGLIYTVAAYLVFYALSKEKAMIIGIINSSQMLLISFFSALLFSQKLLFRSSIIILIMLVGVFLISIQNSGHRSKFSWLTLVALLGNLLWVLMWLIFDSTITKNSNLSFIYFGILMTFSALFGIIFSRIKKVEDRSEIFNKDKKDWFMVEIIVLLGLFNGIGTVLFSFAYVISPVLTPLLTELMVVGIVLLSFIWLKERLSSLQTFGIITICIALILFLI
ncbi:MAG: EamA family transporter [Thermoplasmata archaeon]